MGQSIAVMNTKGGVGKSTVTMALAETLSSYHNKNVLVIDSDSQTSISIMMSPMARWEQMEHERRTLVELLSASVLVEGEADWKAHVLDGVSDVDDAKTVYLLPSHMNLTLFEREVSAGRRHSELRQAIRNLLDDVARYFDVILVDCPPGLSVLTECWLRECDFYLPPTKADYLSVRGLDILKRFRDFSAQHGFGDLIGVLVNQKDEESASEADWHQKLLSDPANRCFLTAIPRRPFIQRAADFHEQSRSFLAKYPGDAGAAIRALAAETLDRMSAITILRSRMVGDDEALNAEVDRLIAEAMRDTLERRRSAQAQGQAPNQGQRPPAAGQRGPATAPAPAPATKPSAPPVAQHDSPTPPPPKAASRDEAAAQPARPTSRPETPERAAATQPARSREVQQAVAPGDARPAMATKPEASSWGQRVGEGHMPPTEGRGHGEAERRADPTPMPGGWPTAERPAQAPRHAAPTDQQATQRPSSGLGAPVADRAKGPQRAQVPQGPQHGQGAQAPQGWAPAPVAAVEDGEEIIALQPRRATGPEWPSGAAEPRQNESAAQIAASAASTSSPARTSESEPTTDEDGDDVGILDLGGLVTERRTSASAINGEARAAAPLDAFSGVLRRPFGPGRALD